MYSVIRLLHIGARFLFFAVEVLKQCKIENVGSTCWVGQCPLGGLYVLFCQQICYQHEGGRCDDVRILRSGNCRWCQPKASVY